MLTLHMYTHRDGLEEHPRPCRHPVLMLVPTPHCHRRPYPPRAEQLRDLLTLCGDRWRFRKHVLTPIIYATYMHSLFIHEYLYEVSALTPIILPPYTGRVYAHTSSMPPRTGRVYAHTFFIHEQI